MSAPKIHFEKATVTMACDPSVDTIDIGIGSPFKQQEVRKLVSGDSTQANLTYNAGGSPLTFYVQSGGAQSFVADANVTITGGARDSFVVRATDAASVPHTGKWELNGES